MDDEHQDALKKELINNQIPLELMEEINNLKKQNATATYELLKTQKTIQSFEQKLKVLEDKVDSLSNINPMSEEDDKVLFKLTELKRFL